MKTVLVTGSTGFVGRHLVDRLRSFIDLRVVTLTRETVAQSSTINIVCPLEDLTVGFWRANGIEAFDTVFHLASFTPKSTALINSFEDIYRSTIAGTYSLLNSLPSSIGKFIYSSSIDVYGPHRSIVTEQSPTMPSGFHGAAKLLCEAMVAVMAAAKGFRKVVLRYGNLYGPGEDEYQKAIPNFMRAVLAGKRPQLSAEARNAARDFLFVDDAVEATLRAAAHAQEIAGPINVVSGSSTTIRHVLEIISELGGVKLERDAGDDNLATEDVRRFDNKRLTEICGVWPFVPLREGLAREFAYVKALRSSA